jgi:hypothetical protein
MSKSLTLAPVGVARETANARPCGSIEDMQGARKRIKPWEMTTRMDRAQTWQLGDLVSHRRTVSSALLEMNPLSVGDMCKLVTL